MCVTLLGRSIVLPHTLLCIKCLLAGIYLSAKPQGHYYNFSKPQMHVIAFFGDKSCLIWYVYAIKHLLSGFITYTDIVGMIYLYIHSTSTIGAINIHSYMYICSLI